MTNTTAFATASGAQDVLEKGQAAESTSAIQDITGTDYFATGIVSDLAHKDGVAVQVNGSAETVVLTARTAFRGAIEDKVAMGSLRNGMSVNLWVDRGEVKYASINYQ